ncbi:MAG: biopolymer transporter ExbD [Bacteroidales bacterium]
MKIRRNRQFRAEVSTSSLNDIMFFLLLFFLIVSTLANPNVIKLLLPSSNAAQNINKQQVTISVTENLEYYIDNRQVSLTQIEDILKQRLSNVEEPTVVLRFAYNLTIQDLIDVLEIGTRMKVKMVLATNKKDNK